MRWGVIVFPGSCDDQDVFDSLARDLGQKVDFLWHKEELKSVYDCLVLPGGFSYGDYLRCGAMARFSPVMRGVMEFARGGGLVLGICNGFQILCEAGLLPGALLRNDSLQFRCQWVHLRTETTQSPFTAALRPGQVLRVPISHGEGRYYADAGTLARLNDEDRVAFRYCTAGGEVTPDANPNGALENIAGVLNEGRNVLGMMPHPERASELLMGGEDGLAIWRSMLSVMATT
jgi:phosphoribosylformylglycinamidine synthase